MCRRCARFKAKKTSVTVLAEMSAIAILLHSMQAQLLATVILFHSLQLRWLMLNAGRQSVHTAGYLANFGRPQGLQLSTKFPSKIAQLLQRQIFHQASNAPVRHR